MKNEKFSWVHLSDWHFGQREQWMWPNFKSNFLEDLRRQSEQVGHVDLVIFSGDLTQSGSKADFQKLTEELKILWKMWDDIGHRPLLFCVPGNHDLVRPPSNDARMKILTKWISEPEAMQEFWGGKNEETGEDNQYIKLVNDAFQNYIEWQASLNSAGIPTADIVNGLLPGDVSASLNVNNISIGLIGLNTSFLQLNGTDFNGRLALDLRQLNAVTADNPPEWCKKHDINFLVTHHPTSWLCQEALNDFKIEIYPPGRFTAHFYGHMHEANNSTEYRNGDAGRRSLQSASLFGLEYFGERKIERIHGYSLGQINFENDECIWKFWPRKARSAKNGNARKIIPDHDNFELVPGQEYLTEILDKNDRLAKVVLSHKTENVDILSVVEEAVPQWKDALKACSYFLPDEVQHIAIRPLQRQACIEAIRQKSICWVCSDWGLGRDGFISSVIKKNNRESNKIYRIDLGNYDSRAIFLKSFITMMGCAFQEFCKALALAGPSVILFDEAPTSNSNKTQNNIEKDVEELAEMVRDFCPGTIVFILSRALPKENVSTVVHLEPLDEADTRAYLIAHPMVTPELKTKNAVSDIFRRTDGIPGRIEALIKTLRVSNLSDLGPAVQLLEYREIENNEVIPASLISAVSELINSVDAISKRLSFLLKVLAILPHGESVARLKRIDPNYPIHPSHAEELYDRNLIQVRISTSLMGLSGVDGDHVKIIYASRPVRDYLLSQMSDREIDSLIQKAAILYFGDKWKSGSASLKKIGGTLTTDDGSLLENPHSIVVRLLEKNSWSNLQITNALLNLCHIYCSALYMARNYRNCVDVCRDILSMIPVLDFVEQRNQIEYLFANSLRMTGAHIEARERLELLANLDVPKENKNNILINLALCLQSINDKSAIVIAKRILASGAKGGVAIQAEAIIIEMEFDVNNKGRLLQLEQRARSKGFDIAANNLALDRLNSDTIDIETIAVLRKVYSTAIAAGDSYNAARASVRIANFLISINEDLSRQELNNIVSAYQYFYGERYASQFISAHKALWGIFERNNDVINLLSLFRHSSFIWRINGSEENEQIYVRKFVKNSRQILSADILTADKNTAYFLIRAQNEKLSRESKK